MVQPYPHMQAYLSQVRTYRGNKYAGHMMSCDLTARNMCVIMRLDNDDGGGDA